MAIKTFKDIINNKGFRISSNDRALFEVGDIQSFFGFSDNDCIEFVLYDANDNQLPQSTFGLVRYISLTSDNIKDYFLIAEGTLFQKYKFPTEYFIDAERLIKEAGYNNGIFKVQITLINKRVGSEKGLDKLWISEISPSRLEIRLFPVENKNFPNPNLKERFNIFVNGGDFKEDTIRYAISAVESINPNYIANSLKAAYSEQWFQSFISEFKIQGFDIFCTNIYNKFAEACIYEFTDRISDINDLNYGKLKSFKSSVALSKESIISTCEKILIQVLNKFLINPEVKYGGSVIDKFESYDAVTQILQSKESDLNILTNPPLIKEEQIVKPITTVLKPALVSDVIEDIKIKGIGIPDEIILPDLAIKVPLQDSEPIKLEKPVKIPKTKFLDRVRKKIEDGKERVGKLKGLGNKFGKGKTKSLNPKIGVGGRGISINTNVVNDNDVIQDFLNPKNEL